MSNTKVTGILERTHQNARNKWSILVNDQFYGTWDADYSELEGSQVEFFAAKKGQWWNVVGEVKALATEAPEEAKEDTPARPAPPTTTAYDAKQSSIVLQSSYKTAAELVSAALAADAVMLGNKKADKMEIILGLVDEVAFRLYENCIDTTDFLSSFRGVDPDDSFKHVDA